MTDIDLKALAAQAVTAAKAAFIDAHPGVWRGGTCALFIARDAAYRVFEDAGFVRGESSRTSAPGLLANLRLIMAAPGGAVLVVHSGWDSNGPYDVWDYVSIHAADTQETQIASTGAMRAPRGERWTERLPPLTRVGT